MGSGESRVEGTGVEWADFGATHWSVVLTAGEGSSVTSDAAMERLCQAYWFPLYAYVRRKGYAVPEAQDLTQEFFARLLQHRWVAKADPRKGKFRSYLLTAMDHFLTNDWRRAHTFKRGGGRQLVSLDDTAETRYSSASADHLTPEKLYQRRWALDLFDRALRRLQAEYACAGKTGLYSNLREFLSAEPEVGDYERVAGHLELTRGAVAAAVCRLRQRYRELVRDEVAHTVASPAEVEDEVRSLLAALGD